MTRKEKITLLLKMWNKQKHALPDDYKLYEHTKQITYNKAEIFGYMAIVKSKTGSLTAGWMIFMNALYKVLITKQHQNRRMKNV